VLDLIVWLTYLADHTQRVHFGSLVAPLSFRDPVMLALQAAALDDLSSGYIMTKNCMPYHAPIGEDIPHLL
jgi:alkanesulfonate monooxygenase SsuD/methylene tetrahydromethanopterin reductase-like flavin-dependent oxidoreductase (luciferase family)